MKATFDVPASKVEADVSTLSTNVGTLSSLTTTAKSSLVAAVNELDSDIGTLSGKLANYIKRTTVIGTTSANGSLNSNLNAGSVRILNAIPTTENANYYCVLTMTGENNYYWFTIKKLSDNTAVASTSVSVSVYYIDV